jgi:hypothetical protein
MPPICRSVQIYAFPRFIFRCHVIASTACQILICSPHNFYVKPPDSNPPHTKLCDSNEICCASFRGSTTSLIELLAVLFEYVWIPFYYRMHYVTRCRIHPMFHSMQMARDSNCRLTFASKRGYCARNKATREISYLRLQTSVSRKQIIRVNIIFALTVTR